MPTQKSSPSSQVDEKRAIHENEFPDYEKHFGRFSFMVKNIEREVGIHHYQSRVTAQEEIEEIKEKSRKAQKHEHFEKENNFLQRILEIVKRKAKENEDMYYENMEDVVRRGNRQAGETELSNDPVLLGKMLARMAAQNRNQYKRSEKSPYFGKVLFQNYSASEPMELYFGKAAVDLEGEKARVIDWRAPVADLYYKYTGCVKNAFFQAAEREIRGELKLKRQISVEEGFITMISDGTLNEVIKELEDAQIGEDSTDEILISNLDKSAHKRLGEIVATIQAEQNDIIRAPIDKITLVQGVAGAGKTTIALHRLAYLMYNYPDDMKPENILVIAPNDVFLDYISKVLPDLGVENVNQMTVEKYLLEKLELPKDAQIWNKMDVSSKSYEDDDFDRRISDMRTIKCDFRILDLIENLHTKLESQIVKIFQNNPYFPIHSAKVTQDYIRQLFYENRNMPWNKRREYIQNRLIILIEDEMKENSMNPKSAREKAKSEIVNLNKFLSKLEYPSLIDAYKQLFGLDEVKELCHCAAPRLNGERNEVESDNLMKVIISSLEQNIIYSDDLPLLYKVSELYESKKFNDFDYVVVDEAQDLSPIELEVLRQNTKENKLCIVGDINQTIHDKGRFRTLFEQMTRIFGEESFSFHKLLKSYRSTIEITSFANQVLEKLDAAHIATPVIRHGPKPFVQSITNDNLENEVSKIVADARTKGRKSIVITARTETKVKEIFNRLENEIEDISYISQDRKNYEVGVHVMPFYLTKGLEFDTVIVVKDEVKKEQTPRELRLEYVMYTRALHELFVLESAETK